MSEYIIKIISYKKDWLVIRIKKDRKGMIGIGLIGQFKELKEAYTHKILIEFILKRSKKELKKIEREVREYERQTYIRRSSASIS